MEKIHEKIKTVDDYFYDLKNALLESAKDIVKQVETEVSSVVENLDKEKLKLTARSIIHLKAGILN